MSEDHREGAQHGSTAGLKKSLGKCFSVGGCEAAQRDEMILKLLKTSGFEALRVFFFFFIWDQCFPASVLARMQYDLKK